MSPEIEHLRDLLESRNISGFLEVYQVYRQSNGIDPVVTGWTQRILPSLLREAFNSQELIHADIVRLWRLVRESRQVLVDNDLIVTINERINDAIKEVAPDTKLPVQLLATFDDVRETVSTRPNTVPQPLTSENSEQLISVKRVVVASAYSLGVWSTSDAFNFRKNVCASRQEFEFLKAVRQYFPSLQAYPNQPLKNFIDIEKFEERIPLRIRNYAWLAQVDVLLCTSEEDPVMGIELDSRHHDSEEAVQLDEQKHSLFQLAGIPLIRIRSTETTTVRAEDFYDLLVAEAATLDKIRPRRLRPRQSHDCLVPHEMAFR